MFIFFKNGGQHFIEGLFFIFLNIFLKMMNMLITTFYRVYIVSADVS